VVCTIDYSAKEVSISPLGNKIFSDGQENNRNKKKRKTKPEIRATKKNKMLLVQTAELSEEELEKVQS
jgi:hypothetical protein